MTTLTPNFAQSIENGSVGTIHRLQRLAWRWIKTQELKARVSRERRQLSELSDTMLSDLGITLAQAQAEARRIDLPRVRLNALESDLC